MFAHFTPEELPMTLLIFLVGILVGMLSVYVVNARARK